MGEAVIIERGGKRIALAHGHEVDPFNSSSVPGKGRVLAIIAGMFEDVVGSPFLPNKKSVESSLLGIGEFLLSLFIQLYMKVRLSFSVSTPEQIKVRKGLTASKSQNLTDKNINSWEEIKEKEGFDILVCGHTHRPGVKANSDGVVWYYNSGSWASPEEKNTCLKIDISGTITLHKWEDNKLVSFEKTL